MFDCKSNSVLIDYESNFYGTSILLWFLIMVKSFHDLAYIATSIFDSNRVGLSIETILLQMQTRENQMCQQLNKMQ